MKKKTFIIFDFIVQIIAISILLFWLISGYEFLEGDFLGYFILLGFWQLAAASIKHNHYEIQMKPYLIMVRNFTISLITVLILGYILVLLNSVFAVVLMILLFIILLWSFILAILYFYITICQLIGREDIRIVE